MSAVARAFFAEVNRNGAQRVPPMMDGTLRFDVRDGDQVRHWLLRMEHGDVRSEETDGPADCVVTVDSELFDQILQSRERIDPAVVRYALGLEGMFPLILMFRRLLPDTPGARHPRQMADGWRRAR
ncbi:SCP2 sterol-binding domain-containing protein [Solwaraspora sp. WMMD406]|uniref:SCP2 sterol-binding domain-containing protein n=1 Tax=Solwaraspora sp. WMMD406 TaxID=3016095 RepID=UPI002417ECAE|nr:SCP2 sterol-binding domain-containing protein [Solwaraspora sp. WMMD406]MDG4766857.1 SCP2 sterol-binding domain-containing protein [Solwaraspora sp. WMMD406]